MEILPMSKILVEFEVVFRIPFHIAAAIACYKVLAVKILAAGRVSVTL